VCCLNSDGQFLGNRVQKHCNEHYQDSGGGVDSVIAKHHGVGGYVDTCNNTIYSYVVEVVNI